MGEETGSEGKIVYEERMGYSIWLPALIYVAIVGFGVAFVINLVLGTYLLAVPFGALTVFLSLLWLNFRVLEFRITEWAVCFGFGLIQKQFPRSRVISCDPYELKFSNYLGYGIRGGFDRTIAYNTRNGPGVKMVVEGEKRPYVVSVDDPGTVCGILGLGGQGVDVLQ